MKRAIALHDLTAEPIGNRLRLVRELRAGAPSPLAAPDFNDEVERLSTAEQRHETGERLRRLRRAS